MPFIGKNVVCQVNAATVGIKLSKRQLMKTVFSYVFSTCQYYAEIIIYVVRMVKYYAELNSFYCCMNCFILCRTIFVVTSTSNFSTAWNIMWNAHSIFLQIDDPDVPRGDRTFRLLCSYFNTDVETCRETLLPEFCVSHRDWIEVVSKKFLKKSTPRGQPLYRYLRYLPIHAFPLDLLGIMIMACMYHSHVAVFVNESYWTTHYKNDFRKCKVFLVYRGELIFDDSRLMTGPEYAVVRQEVNKYKLAIYKHNKKVAEQEKALAKQMEKEEEDYSDDEIVTLRNPIESDPEEEEENQKDNDEEPDLEEMMQSDSDPHRDMETDTVQETAGESSTNIMQKEDGSTDIMQKQNSNDE